MTKNCAAKHELLKLSEKLAGVGLVDGWNDDSMSSDSCSFENRSAQDFQNISF